MAQVQLHSWDWVFLIWFLAVTLGVGVYYTRRAGRNLSEYFLSGRDLPWWALGTSMVATTFAADTPLVVSGLVLSQGVAGNWLWWNFLFGATLTVFVFARWWRRSGAVTEVELIDLRYAGRAARVLRGFKALYLGLLVNSIIFGWVTKAMTQVLGVVTGWDTHWVTLGLILITMVYTILSGLWGVVATDVLQFAMAMAGAIIMAVLSVSEVGGLGALVEKVTQLEQATGRDFLSFFPRGWEGFAAAVTILVLVNWWAVYYPGAEPGGGGYVAQRMLAAKDERHARGGTLWFTLAHYCLRPWPWILVGLAAVVLDQRYLDPGKYGPQFAPELAYPAMFRVLPLGMRGLVVASFFAAFMSTICTQLNLAASYVVNDFYLPFVARGKVTDRQAVGVARVVLAVVTVAGCLVSWLLISVSEGWMLIMQFTAGTGLVLVLRWLWWRVNAWSEISAMLASTLTFLATTQISPVRAWLRTAAGGQKELENALVLVITVGVTTVVWITVTLLTKPVPADRLEKFFRQVRPAGRWGPVARRCGLPGTPLRRDLGLWVAATAFVLGVLFGVGSALFQNWTAAGWLGALAVAGAAFVVWGLRREAAEAGESATASQTR